MGHLAEEDDIGAQRIAMLWYAIARRHSDRVKRELTTVNGEPALASYYGGVLHSVAVFETDGEVIHSIYTIANPDKLRSFRHLSQLRA